MAKVTKSAPWTEYTNKLKALFAKDRDIDIKADDTPDDTGTYLIKLYVHDYKKAFALDQILPGLINFGSVEVRTLVLPANEEEDLSYIELFRRAFKGNGAVEEIISDVGLLKGWNYVVFKPEIVQFYDDNLASYYGIKTTLYEDIAREIFDQNSGNIFFCTGNKEVKG